MKKTIYSLILIFLVSCSSEKKNIDDILIHGKIDTHFSKKEIKKYSIDIGMPKPQVAMNIYSKIFQRNFKLVQIIFNDEDREIYSISGIYYMDPEKCISLRNKKINDFKIFSKIDNDFEKYKDEQDYRISKFNRKISRVGYSNNKHNYYVAITCYDNRNVYTPTGEPYATKGELRFEIISDKYKLN